jgi:isopenicillin N synthase-like dioxygenase
MPPCTPSARATCTFRRSRCAHTCNAVPHPCPRQPAAIPVIDLSAGDEAAAAAALGAACRGSGFFLVSGHGVAGATVDGMFDQLRRLFGLPLAEKMKLLQVKPKACAHAPRPAKTLASTSAGLQCHAGGSQGRAAAGLAPDMCGVRQLI